MAKASVSLRKGEDFGALEFETDALKKNFIKTVSRVPIAGRLRNKTTRAYHLIAEHLGGLFMPDTFYKQKNSKFHACCLFLL